MTVQATFSFHTADIIFMCIYVDHNHIGEESETSCIYLVLGSPFHLAINKISKK